MGIAGALLAVVIEVVRSAPRTIREQVLKARTRADPKQETSLQRAQATAAKNLREEAGSPAGPVL